MAASTSRTILRRFHSRRGTIPIIGCLSFRAFVLHRSSATRAYSTPSRNNRAFIHHGLKGIGWVFVGILIAEIVKYQNPRRLEGPASIKSKTEDEDFVLYKPMYGPVRPEIAEARLRYLETSRLVGGSVLRSDHVCVPSNSPCEDFSTAVDDYEIEYEDSEEPAPTCLSFEAIFDGHAGIATAHTLTEYLLAYVFDEIREGLSSNEIDDAIKRAFLGLDRDIMEMARRAVVEPRLLADALAETHAAYAGSCALLSMFDVKTNRLKVACTGDSRAVLGRKNSSGKWEAIPLSIDQTGHNSDEIARLQAAHPNEPDMIKDGRLLGLAVTRAFGDGRWKWPRNIQEKARDRYFGPAIREPLISPPYLTAEPVITTTEIIPEKGDFLIMASDGLWDNLSNQQAVELVARWRVTHDITQPAPESDVSEPEQRPWARSELSREMKPKLGKEYSKGVKISENDYVYKDDNAATHLARHALGGGNLDWFTGLMTGAGLGSRNKRDDITVTVVFFGKAGPKSWDS